MGILRDHFTAECNSGIRYTELPLASICFIYAISQKKNVQKLFLSALHQISTNFDNCRHKDGREDKIMWDALIFHLN